jgi:phospholipid/cholesterol/gamma-HCH transport system substrate-binding protein
VTKRKSALAVTGPLIKSVIFLVATLLVLTFISIELGERFGLDDTHRYVGVFTDSSGLMSGQTVRIGGVKVGTVHSVKVQDSKRSVVSFDVNADRPIPRNARLAIRYLNLTGDRFLEIRQGPGAEAPPLPQNGTIPIAQTTPALDLDVLLAGFNPLFEGLDADQINSLSTEIVSVFQGEGGTIDSILARAASLTSTLADRDAVIGQLVHNLNIVLGTLDRHGPQLKNTIDQLQTLVSGLANDRGRLGDSLAGTDRLVTSLAGLLTKVRGPLRNTVTQLDRATTQANAGEAEINTALRMLPGAYLRIGRVGARGSTYGLYVCSLRLKLTGPDGQPFYTPYVGPAPNADRCKFGTAPLETPEQRVRKEEQSREGGGSR